MDDQRCTERRQPDPLHRNASDQPVGRKYLLASLDQSLKRMGLPYVDIFYHHRMDADTPLEETMGALEQAVRSGKALYVGLSNYNGETLEKATAILNELHVPFVINQNRYSIFDRTIEHNGLLETTQRLHKGLITFSPLAQGMLTDRYLNGIPADSRIRTDGRFLKEAAVEEKLPKIRALNELAAQRNFTQTISGTLSPSGLPGLFLSKGSLTTSAALQPASQATNAATSPYTSIIPVAFIIYPLTCLLWLF